MICATDAPIVSFTENGNPFSGNDSGNILDTFGYDLVNLGPPTGDSNESIAWHVLGTGGGRGTVPEPGSILLLGTVACALASRFRKRPADR